MWCSFDTISILRLRPRRGDSGHRVSCLASSAASERFQSERLDKDYGDLNVRCAHCPASLHTAL